jgi:hypothetical protein
MIVLIIKSHNAFLDEHGTHKGSDLVAVGGLVSSYNAWVRAEDEWGRILKSKKIDQPFHFTDFMARRPPWNWPDPERDTFMERLCTTIGENITVGIAFGVFREDYEVLPAQLRVEFKDIYHACSYFCLESSAK